MVRLLDVNVLIALVDSAHTHHERAQGWLAQHQGEPWATCPMTENGFVRVLSDRKYPNLSLSPQQAATLLARLKAAVPAHQWWPEGVAITDTNVFQMEVLLGSRHVTDAYLLGLAFRNSGRLTSFDTGLPWRAIRNAGPDLVEII